MNEKGRAEVLALVDKYLDPEEVMTILVENSELQDYINIVGESEFINEVASKYEIDEIFEGDVIEEWFVSNKDLDDYVDYGFHIDKYIENTSPEEAYGYEYMNEYVFENYFEYFVNSVREDGDPGDIYTEEQLLAWVEQNGYVKEGSE